MDSPFRFGRPGGAGGHHVGRRPGGTGAGGARHDAVMVHGGRSRTGPGVTRAAPAGGWPSGSGGSARGRCARVRGAGTGRPGEAAHRARPRAGRDQRRPAVRAGGRRRYRRPGVVARVGGRLPGRSGRIGTRAAARRPGERSCAVVLRRARPDDRPGGHDGRGEPGHAVPAPSGCPARERCRTAAAASRRTGGVRRLFPLPVHAAPSARGYPEQVLAVARAAAAG